MDSGDIVELLTKGADVRLKSMRAELIVDTRDRDLERSVARKLLGTDFTDGAVPLQDSFYLQSCDRIKKVGQNNGYMTTAERDKYRARVKDGKLYNWFGEIVNGVYQFSFDVDMTLYVAEEHMNPEVPNHDFFTAGLPVRGTGFLAFKQGRLIAISNNSGHYIPTVHQMWQALSVLYQIFGKEQFQQVAFEVWYVEDQQVHKTTYYAIDVLKHFNSVSWRKAEQVDWYNLTNVWDTYNNRVNLADLFPEAETLSLSSLSSDDEGSMGISDESSSGQAKSQTEGYDDVLEGDDPTKSSAQKSRFGAVPKGFSNGVKA